MKSSARGFTFVEVMVVISVIAIIASVIWINFGQASAESRDAKRKADLTLLKNAIELYNQKYGRYPDGCNGPDEWASQLESDNACNTNFGIYANYADTNEFIVGHEAGITFSPEFIRAIPVDPKPNIAADSSAGYSYLTNGDGSAYKLTAYHSAENEEVTDYAHPFAFCDMDGSVDTAICVELFTSDLSSFTGAPNHCDPNHGSEGNRNRTRFRTSYAVWGGFATPEYDPWDSRYEDSSEQLTEDIICERP